MPAVQLESVSKRFGSHQAVQSLDLTIPRGSIQGFIGPNGSGKTTTLRMILGIIRPDAGRLVVLGREDPRAANDAVGYLPEERGLYRKMTVRRVATYFAGLKGLSGRRARLATDRWLERFGLEDRAGSKVETLSKGMQQKVQFICTVLSEPELVILDEPFSGLDPLNLEVFREAVLELERAGKTVIFSTHDMAKAEEMCDRVLMLHRGEKVIDGSLEEIRAREGGEVVRVRTPLGAAALEGLPGVHAVRDLGRIQEFKSDADRELLLRSLLERTRIDLFEVAHASLHDIFLRIAGESTDRREEVA